MSNGLAHHLFLLEWISVYLYMLYYGLLNNEIYVLYEKDNYDGVGTLVKIFYFCAGCLMPTQFGCFLFIFSFSQI